MFGRTHHEIDIKKIRRERFNRSFYAFVRHFWKSVEPTTNFIDNWHILTICEHLQAVTEGRIRNLIIEVPPGCMKSLLVSVFWNAWEWTLNPGLSYLCVSFDEGLTVRDADRVKTLMRSDEFVKLYGDFLTLSPFEAKNDFKTYSQFNREKQTPAGGWRFSTSVRGKITGKHPDRRIVDDPIKPTDITPESLEKVNDWWKSTLVSRAKNQSTVATVLIMQRLAANDLAGFLGEQEDFQILRLPMRFDPFISSRSSIEIQDPRTEKGELLYPGRFDEDAVKRLEINMGPLVASAQLQQNPTPDSGSVFNRDWFLQRYDEIPKNGNWIQSWDLTFKDTAGSDFVCGQVWIREANRYYLVDQIFIRADFTQTLQLIRDFDKKWPKAITKLIEDKANGPAVINVLSKELNGIIAVTPTGGKVARANAITGILHAKQVYFPNADFMGDYTNQLVQFPKAKNDDMVDATTQALNYLVHNAGFNLSAAMKQAKISGLLR